MSTPQFSPSFYAEDSEFGDDNLRVLTSLQNRKEAAGIRARSAERNSQNEFHNMFNKSMEYFGYKDSDRVDLDVFTANHLIKMKAFNLRLLDLFQLGSALTFQQLRTLNIKGLERYEKSRLSLALISLQDLMQLNLFELHMGDLLRIANSTQLSLEDHSKMAAFLNFSISDLKNSKKFRSICLADVDRFTSEMLGFRDLNELNLADLTLNQFFKLNVLHVTLKELLGFDLPQADLYELFRLDVANYKQKQSDKLNFAVFQGSNLAELNLLEVFLGDLLNLKNFNAAAHPEMKWLNGLFGLHLREVKKLAGGKDSIQLEDLKKNLGGAHRTESQINFANYGRIPSKHSFPGKPAFYDKATNTYWDGSRGFTWTHQSQKEAEPSQKAAEIQKKPYQPRSQYINQF